MNRIEFMTQLAALLQDVPVEERREAMQYYNDYFDDAGSENEQQVIAELESPEKVAENIKADLKGESEDGGVFTNTQTQQTVQQTHQTEPAKTNNALKILLIIAIILVGGPVIIPLALGIAGAVIACIAALFAVFVSIVAAAVAVAIVGVILTVQGIIILIPDFVVGLGLLGTGLILTVLGVIGTVAGVKLCIVVIPCIFRAIVAICRKPFHRKAVA